MPIQNFNDYHNKNIYWANARLEIILIEIVYYECKNNFKLLQDVKLILCIKRVLLVEMYIVFPYIFLLEKI